ncbi:MAG: response regulator, partial [Campylobacterota bacterium]|nr:response regulator [Campylobacterota bacterium]
SDIQMPRLNGLEMIEKIRKKDKTTQIIITTAHLKTEYLLRAVELQLVKYLGKPLYESELIGALKTALAFMQTKESSTLLLGEEYSYDLLNRSLFHQEEFVKLNAKELQLLEICAKNSKRVVTYSELNNQIWEGEMSEYALSSLVKDLRKKLPKGSLENVSGVGYRLKCL